MRSMCARRYRAGGPLSCLRAPRGTIIFRGRSSVQLVVAEKPSVAADLAHVIDPGAARRQGWLQGRQYAWTWALGHLAELAPPESYQPALKGRWRLELLPVVPATFRVQAREGRTAQLAVIRHLLAEAEAVVVATDAGREGELIWEYIREVCGYAGPAQRLWLSESTPTAVRAAFAALQPPRSDLAAAARARACADWVIGMNATMALSARHGGLWSAGRVQTPTLALLTAREAESRAFRPTEYVVVTVAFAAVESEFRGRWFRGKEDRLAERAAAEAIAAKVRGQPARVASLTRKRTREAPPRLFNLNDLQRAANALHGLTAADTLKAAQTLYERHKAITYPRTDSRHVSAEAFATFPERLRAIGGELAPVASRLAADLPHPGKRVVDDAQVSDHHALLPTAAAPDPAGLSPAEGKVYALVVRRFLAALLPPAVYADTEAITEVAGETFRSRSRVLLTPGWREAEPQVAARDKDEDDEEPAGGNLSRLHQGMEAACTDAEVAARQTKPPKRFTEATLLQVMETAGRLVDDEALAAAMRERGLGTPATRAQIIETLIARDYVLRQGKSLVPTERGERLVALAPPELREPATPGEWEQRLRAIEAGSEAAGPFLGDIAAVTRRIVADVGAQARAAPAPGSPAPGKRPATAPAGAREVGPRQQSGQPAASGTPAQDTSALGTCPRCGGPIVESPKAYGCANWRPEAGGCRWALWKKVAGKTLSPVQARELLARGETKRVLKGFTSQAGRKFDAQLRLERETGRVSFVFPSAAPTSANVPGTAARAAMKRGPSRAAGSPGRT